MPALFRQEHAGPALAGNWPAGTAPLRSQPQIGTTRLKNWTARAPDADTTRMADRLLLGSCTADARRWVLVMREGDTAAGSPVLNSRKVEKIKNG
jgi:hypothetical protein